MKIAVIGGGAAGMFAAITAASSGLHIILFEKTVQLLTKVKISGGGRCNVTHACFEPKELIQNYPRGSKELLGPFTRFQPKDMITWLAKRGVIVKTESDGRMFPVTDSSQTIIDCFMKEANKAGVTIRIGEKIQSIEKKKDQFFITSSSEQYSFDKLLLATGSSRQGYEWAIQYGHTLIDPVPSLFTFNVPNSPLEDLAGISVDCVKVSLLGTNLNYSGPLLITHWGFSGPVILKLSAWGARLLFEKKYQCDFAVQWVTQSLESIREKIDRQKQLGMKGLVINESLFSLPKNLWKRLVTLSGIDLHTKWSEMSKASIAKLSQKLFSDIYQIDGKTTYKQEFVTSGGIKLSEVNFKTMESRMCPGLYFAGEILDIDGITGGFNFQAAWTTSWIAAESFPMPHV